MSNLRDITGMIFGDWKVIEFDNTKGKYKYYWICKCINCGNIKSIASSSLLDGKSNNYKTAPVKGGGWRVASKAYVDAKVPCDERMKKDFTCLPSNIDTIFDSLKRFLLKILL